MTERTSDEDDIADYTDDHGDEHKDGRPVPAGEVDAPDVAETEHEPPD